MTADTDASTKFGSLQPINAQVKVLPIKNLQVGSTSFLPQPGIGNNKPRLIGIDVTRGLALLGMIAVHALIPYDDNFEPNWVSYIATGHASAVFAVLAGVGLSLTTGRARVPWSKALPTAAGVGGRALAIAAVGFALGYTDAEITGVILPYYAVLFLLSIPLLFLRTRSLVMVGIVAAVAVPVLSQFVRPALPIPTLENPTFSYLLTDPLGLLSELLVTGAYPALPWMAYLSAGLIVGRLTLSSLKVARRMLIVGVLLAVSAGVAALVLLGPLGGRAALQLAGPGLGDGDADSVNDLLTFGFDGTTPTTSWWWLATGAPHAATPLDLLGTVGSAVALLGAMLVLGHVVQPLLRKVIDVVSAPLAAAGAMTLTLYTAHVVFMNSPLDVFEPMDGYIFQVAAVLLFGLGWRLAVGRGPLETAVTAFATWARTRVTSAIEHRGADQQPAAGQVRDRRIIEIPSAPMIPAPLRAAGQTVEQASARQGSVRLRHQVVAKKTNSSPPATTVSSRPTSHSAVSGSKGAAAALASTPAATATSGSMSTTGAANLPNRSAGARDDAGQKAAPAPVADLRPLSVRLTGVDITRGLALLGMMAVHTLIPYDENFDPNWVSYIATGHSAATFAVLAGVGLSLTTGRARVPRGKAGATAAAIAGRAGAIGLIGLILGYTDASIAGVILPYYAVLFVLAIPLLFMRTRAVVVVGLVAAIVVPVLSQLLRPALPAASGENLTLGYVLSDPLRAVSELLFTGAYPVLPWMAYICAGIVVGRLDLSSVRNARRLLIGGAMLGLVAFSAAWALLGPLGGSAALRTAGAGDFGIVDDLLAFGFDGTTPTTSWWWLAVGSSHAGTPLDLLGTIGGALALLGAMLLLGHIAQPILRRVINMVTAPVAAAGAMTLTLYTAHIVFMNSQLEIFEPTAAYIIQVVAVLLFGLIWRRAVGRGPLEAAVAKVGAWARALASSRQSDDGFDRASVADFAKLTGSVTEPVAVAPVIQQSVEELGTQPSTIDRSVIDPVGRKLSMHGPVLSRPVPASGSRRLPGPFVARPPRKGEGTHRRPTPGRP